MIQNTSLQRSMNDVLVIPGKRGYRVLRVKNIVLLEADSNYCHIHLLDGTKFLVSKTLKYVAAYLDPRDFVRIHQSFLVNIKCITSINTRKRTTVSLRNNIQIAVSRSRKQDLLRKVRCSDTWQMRDTLSEHSSNHLSS